MKHTPTPTRRTPELIGWMKDNGIKVKRGSRCSICGSRLEMLVHGYMIAEIQCVQCAFDREKRKAIAQAKGESA